MNVFFSLMKRKRFNRAILFTALKILGLPGPLRRHPDICACGYYESHSCFRLRESIVRPWLRTNFLTVMLTTARMAVTMTDDSCKWHESLSQMNQNGGERTLR